MRVRSLIGIMVGRLRMTVDEALDSFAEFRQSLFGQHPRVDSATSRSYAANEAQSTLQRIITYHPSTQHHSSSIEEPFEDQKDRTRT